MSRQIGAKRQKYEAETLAHTANMVRSNSISLNQASKKFGVPKTTIQNAVHNKYSGHKVGHKTFLNASEEQRIADWAMHMSKIGYGRTRQELVSTVKKILDDDGRVTPFRDNKPGRAWIDAFFRRHQEHRKNRLENGFKTLRHTSLTKLVTKIYLWTQRVFIMPT